MAGLESYAVSPCVGTEHTACSWSMSKRLRSSVDNECWFENIGSFLHLHAVGHMFVCALPFHYPLIPPTYILHLSCPSAGTSTLASRMSSACGKHGEVTCCDGFTRFFHKKCLKLGSESRLAAEQQTKADSWYCPVCVHAGRINLVRGVRDLENIFICVSVCIGVYPTSWSHGLPLIRFRGVNIETKLEDIIERRDPSKCPWHRHRRGSSLISASNATFYARTAV